MRFPIVVETSIDTVVNLLGMLFAYASITELVIGSLVVAGGLGALIWL